MELIEIQLRGRRMGRLGVARWRQGEIVLEGVRVSSATAL
jgi:hypothetical protein